MNQDQVTKVLIEASMLMQEGYSEDFENLIANIKKRKEAPMPTELKAIYDKVDINIPSYCVVKICHPKGFLFTNLLPTFFFSVESGLFHNTTIPFFLIYE